MYSKLTSDPWLAQPKRRAIPRTPLLDGVDDWPKSPTRKQWFEITRRLVQNTIDEMDLDPAAMSEIEEAFIGAGLL